MLSLRWDKHCNCKNFIKRLEVCFRWYLYLMWLWWREVIVVVFASGPSMAILFANEYAPRSFMITSFVRFWNELQGHEHPYEIGPWRCFLDFGVGWPRLLIFFGCHGGNFFLTVFQFTIYAIRFFPLSVAPRTRKLPPVSSLETRYPEVVKPNWQLFRIELASLSGKMVGNSKRLPATVTVSRFKCLKSGLNVNKSVPCRNRSWNNQLPAACVTQNSAFAISSNGSANWRPLIIEAPAARVASHVLQHFDAKCLIRPVCFASMRSHGPQIHSASRLRLLSCHLWPVTMREHIGSFAWDPVIEAEWKIRISFSPSSALVSTWKLPEVVVLAYRMPINVVTFVSLEYVEELLQEHQARQHWIVYVQRNDLFADDPEAQVSCHAKWTDKEGMKSLVYYLTVTNKAIVQRH